MKSILSSLSLNISSQEIYSDKPVSSKERLIAFFFSSISLSYILDEMVFTYRNKEGWVEILLVILYSFLYSTLFILFISFLTTLFLIKNLGLKKSIHFSIIANSPLIAIALIGLLFQVQSGYLKVLGVFPEHALIIGAYLTIFSHVRLVSISGKGKAIFYLFLLSIILYVFMGPIMFNLFQL